MKNIEIPAKIQSPVTGTDSILVKRFPVCEIIQYYKKNLHYNVDYLFKGYDEIGLYKCPDTGYLFFYPGVEGDGDFYSQKKKDALSYMDWKWEFEEALRFIGDDMKLLEVGSGAGGFLMGLKNRKKTEACGLELNPAAIASANERGIVIINEMLAQHVNSYTNYYDIVCAYQVLEHIADVKDFMESSYKCLNSSGKLIISVPDNDSFVGELKAFSNMPPYHVGRYTFDSLEKMGTKFGFKMIYKSKEPLQKYHYTSVESVISNKLFGENKYFRRIMFFAGGNWLIKKIVKSSAKWMNGHSIFMVFSKQ